MPWITPDQIATDGPVDLEATIRDAAFTTEITLRLATEAAAFDPFDATFTDDERRGGERALDLFAAMLRARVGR